MNKQQNIFRPKQKSFLWVRVLTGLLVAIVVALAVFPIAVAYGLQSWFKDQGIDDAQVGDVDFNIFTGVAAIKGVSLVDDQQQQLQLQQAQVEFSLRPIFNKRFVVNKILINNMALNILQDESGRLTVAGLPIPAEDSTPSQGQSSANKPWDFAIQQAKLNGVRVQVHTPQLDSEVQIDRFNLENLYSWKRIPASVHLTARLNNSPIELNADMHPFVPSPQYNGTLKVNDLSLQPFAKYVELQIQQLAGQFSTDIDFKIGLSESVISYQHQGSVQLANLTLKNQDITVNNQAVVLEGDVQLSHDPQANSQTMQIQGELESGAQQTMVNRFQADYSQFNWQGNINFRSNPSDEPAEIKTSGRFEVNGLQVNPVDRPLKYAVVETMKVEKYDLKSMNEITINDVSLQNSVFGIVSPESTAEEPAKALIQSRLISVNSIKLNELNKVIVGSLDIDGATANLIREPQNRFFVISDLFPSEQAVENMEPAPSSAMAAGQTANVSVKIDRIRIKDSSKVSFVDTNLRDAFKETLYIEELVIKNIDTEDSDNVSNMALKAKAGEYTGINLSGNAKLFAQDLQLDLQGKIAQLDLPPLSPYTEEALGFDFHSGRLYADINMKIADNKLNGEIKLLIKKLELETSDPGKMQSLTDSLGMSMDSALVLLEDRKKNIKLKIPIQGDLNDPKFNISHAINKAIGKSMKSASVAYLAYAFQPYGSAIILVQLADKARSYVSLDPVIFAAGNIEVSKETSDYLEKVAQVMKDRKQLQLRLCGISTEADRRFIANKQLSDTQKTTSEQGPTMVTDTEKMPQISDHTLEQLAKDRAKRIEAYLVNKHGINQERLYICGPEVDKSQNAKPRVEILI